MTSEGHLVLRANGVPGGCICRKAAQRTGGEGRLGNSEGRGLKREQVMETIEATVGGRSTWKRALNLQGELMPTFA